MKKIALALTLTFLGLFAAKAQDQYEPIVDSNSLFDNVIIDASFITEQGAVSFFDLSDNERVEKIDFFLTKNRKYLPKAKMEAIRETLMGLNEAKLKGVLMMAEDEFKDPTIALVLSLFLGGLGIDRFYIGDIGAGVGKLFTAGGLGVWTIIDWFIIQKRTRENNYKQLMELCGQLNY